MREERRKRLDSIGFSWNPFSELWEARFQELVEYKQVHGSCNVPNRYKANPQLGRWVDKQPRAKTMREERRKRLDSISFTWKVTSKNNA